MTVHDQLGATACRILVPGYSEVYPVDDLVWDNTNKALLFRADVLSLHRLDDEALRALLDRLENNELDDYLDIATLIGIDLVAMCVNDLIVQGAKPIVFLDYIAIPKVIEKKYKQILSGIAKGCRIAGCSLSGGETAEMPGVYTGDSFDLAGFAVGIVGKKNAKRK